MGSEDKQWYGLNFACFGLKTVSTAIYKGIIFAINL